MRSGGRDEDVDREIVLERRQPLDRLWPKRGLPLAGLDHREDERAELVAPREPVVADAEVDAFRQYGDRRIPLESLWLRLDAIRHAVGERGELLHDALRLGAEVDVASTRQGHLLRAVRDQQLDRTLERVEELTYLLLFFSAEDGHESERIGVLHAYGAATLRLERLGDHARRSRHGADRLLAGLVGVVGAPPTQGRGRRCPSG